MKRFIRAIFPLLLALQLTPAFAQSQRVLVFCKTNRYHHASIPAGVEAVRKLGLRDHFTVDTTVDSTMFNAANLKKYSALIFLSPTGNVFSDDEKTAIEQYIRSGGGVVGIHAASTIEKEWAWYGKLVGAVFTDHPEPQQATVIRVDSKNPASRMFPKKWPHTDEWYNFRDKQPELHVLLKVDESTYQGGKLGVDHPVAWYHKFDGGRAFYTALGHFASSYGDPLFVAHLEAGILYAMKRE